MENLSLNTQNTLLLLIDFQTSMAATIKPEVLEKVERNIGLLISASSVLGFPVLVTEQYRKGLGMTIERIRNVLGENYRPFDKLDFSVWGQPDFRLELSRLNRKCIIVSGMEAHVCVLQSALDLVSQGYNVHVAGDAVCSRCKDDWRCGINYMREAGAVITSTEIAIFQLLQRAGTPEFKALSPLFKNRELH